MYFTTNCMHIIVQNSDDKPINTSLNIKWTKYNLENHKLLEIFKLEIIDHENRNTYRRMFHYLKGNRIEFS